MSKKDRFENGMDGHATLSDVKSDIATLRADMTDLMTGLAESGVDVARASARDATEKVSEVATAAKEHVDKTHEQVSAKVSERPITYLALAFGAGALLGRFVGRR